MLVTMVVTEPCRESQSEKGRKFNKRSSYRLTAINGESRRRRCARGESTRSPQFKSNTPENAWSYHHSILSRVCTSLPRSMRGILVHTGYVDGDSCLALRIRPTTVAAKDALSLPIDRTLEQFVGTDRSPMEFSRHEKLVVDRLVRCRSRRSTIRIRSNHNKANLGK